jgi:uncharacterized protein
VGSLYADFRFKPEDTKVLIVTPDQVFAEYMTHAKAAGTGRGIRHLFAGRLVEERGQIKLLRESLNVVAAVQALNPKGAAGLPPPPTEIFSVPYRTLALERNDFCYRFVTQEWKNDTALLSF